MTEKEQLWYLIDKLLKDEYQIKIFCDEFTRIYDLEIDYDDLSIQENKLFNELSSMTGRFSENEEELKIPNMYFSKEDIISKVKEIAVLIKNWTSLTLVILIEIMFFKSGKLDTDFASKSDKLFS